MHRSDSVCEKMKKSQSINGNLVQLFERMDERAVVLPAKPYLIFDMDETILHAVHAGMQVQTQRDPATTVQPRRPQSRNDFWPDLEPGAKRRAKQRANVVPAAAMVGKAIWGSDFKAELRPGIREGSSHKSRHSLTSAKL